MTPEGFGSSEAGRKGALQLAKQMTKEERRNRARKAAMARWTKDGDEPIQQATHEGFLRIIGDLEISCYVLENGERIVSTRGMMKGLGRTWRGRKYAGTELPVFLEAKNLKAFVDGELATGPITKSFLTPGGMLAEGILGEQVPNICNVYLRARDAGVLTTSQIKVARQADLLMRGFATVGIVALIDEATGFQDDRDRRALATILEKFIAKELRAWVKTFPLDYYRELCRLRSVTFSPDMKLPQYFGHLTNDVIYSRLAPGVLAALKKRNPVIENGGRRHKHHQHLTTDVGHPKLLQHLGSVVTLMKISPDWETFAVTLDKIHPVHKEYPLWDHLESD